MITNIFPAFNPAATAITTNDPDQSNVAGEPAAQITATNDPSQTRAPIAPVERSDDADDSGLLHTAKHLIKDALKDFRHGVKDSLRDLGFEGKLVHKLTKGVMHAAKNALRSGADFSARLMVAAVSITSTAGARGGISSFSLVAHSIEININHSTGSIDIAAADLSIEGQAVAVAGADQPHLLDVRDSDPVSPLNLIDELRGLLDLDEISGEDDDDESAPDALLPIAQLNGTDGDVAAPPVDGAVEPVAEDPAPAETPTADAPAEPTAPSSYVRISIAAFEQYLNDLNQQITYVRLDAFIPLIPKQDETTVTQIEPADIPEQPVEETNIALVA